jgi:hypothetical protein
MLGEDLKTQGRNMFSNLDLNKHRTLRKRSGLVEGLTDEIRAHPTGHGAWSGC